MSYHDLYLLYTLANTSSGCVSTHADKVLRILKKTKFPPNRSRSNASGVDKELTRRYLKNSNYKWKGVMGNACLSFTIGYIKPRRLPNTAPLVLSRPTLRNHELYTACRKYIHMLNKDFKYTTICVNKNFKCTPHVDAQNENMSLIVGLGDYTGGNLIIGGTKHNIRYAPVIFNGGKEKHWNDDITEGTKYSLVFFTSKGKLPE